MKHGSAKGQSLGYFALSFGQVGRKNTGYESAVFGVSARAHRNLPGVRRGSRGDPLPATGGRRRAGRPVESRAAQRRATKSRIALAQGGAGRQGAIGR